MPKMNETKPNYPLLRKPDESEDVILILQKMSRQKENKTIYLGVSITLNVVFLIAFIGLWSVLNIFFPGGIINGQ